MKKLKILLLAFFVLFVGVGLTACNNGNKKYTITYQLTKDMTNENPTSYTENTETIILKDLEDTIEFEFLGWYNGETKITEIKKGSKGNLTLTAKWGKMLLIKYNDSVVGVTPAGKASQKIEIPDGITSISENAFSYCTVLSEVIIPDSVTNIEKGAFIGCSSLEEMTLPFVGESETKNAFLGYIFGASSYLGNSNYVPESLKKVTITKAISIGNSAFYNCSSLTSVNIPDSITSVGDDAFLGCSNLEYNVYDNAKYLGNNENPYLVLVEVITNTIITCTISDNTKIICSSAFKDCSGLTSITIPNSVTSIGSYSFSGCYKLVEVYNLSSLNIKKGSVDNGYVGYYAKDIYTQKNEPSKLKVSDGVVYYINETEKIAVAPNNINATSIVIDNDCTEIDQYAFSNCTSLTSVTIPDSVTSIGGSAFKGCSRLNKMALPFVGGSETKNTYLGYIFGANEYTENYKYVPKSLKKVTITKATSIGSYAFYNCSNLTSITILDNVMFIVDDAFNYCSGLTSVNIPDSITRVGDAFYDCISLQYNIYDNAKYLGNDENPYLVLVEAINKDITTCNINGNTKIICYCAFKDCSSLTKINIPNSVTTIEGYAFYDCISLQYNIYDNAKYLGNDENPYLVLVKAINTDITTCTINNNTKIIYNNAFSGCSNLTSITIPSCVTNILSGAFVCDNLKSIIFEDTKGWSWGAHDWGNTLLTSAELSNASNAAELLKRGMTYYYKG